MSETNAVYELLETRIRAEGIEARALEEVTATFLTSEFSILLRPGGAARLCKRIGTYTEDKPHCCYVDSGGRTISLKGNARQGIEKKWRGRRDSNPRAS